MKYKISLDGCDDSTEFEMELTSAEYEFLQTMVAQANKEAEKAHCKPTMEIKEVK